MIKETFPILPVANTFVVGGLLLIEPNNKIDVRAITDWFAARHRVLVWFTPLVFYSLPWLQWNEHHMEGSHHASTH